MKLLTVVGDPHCENKNLDKIEKLFEIVEALGNTTVWLGDMLHNKEVIRGKSLNTLYERFKKSQLQHIILVGNHDWFNLECKEHSLEVLKSLKNVTVVDKPTVIEAMLFLPYMEDLSEFRRLMKNPGKQGATKLIAFIHQGVVGFDYGNGFVADGNGHGEVEGEALKNWELIISGHFHKYAKEGNLTFLGTPFTHSFGESGQEKYIGILDLEEKKLELLEPSFPRHITLEIDLEVGKDSNKALTKKIKKNSVDGDYLRVILKGNAQAIASLDKSKFEGVKFLEKTTEELEQFESVISEEDSNMQKFYKWATEIRKLDEETIKLGLEILGDSQ